MLSCASEHGIVSWGNVIMMVTMCEATEDLGRREGIVVVEIF